MTGSGEIQALTSPKAKADDCCQSFKRFMCLRLSAECMRLRNGTSRSLNSGFARCTGACSVTGRF
jgi:hypothetical protein